MVPQSLPYCLKWSDAGIALLLVFILGSASPAFGADTSPHRFDLHGYFRTGLGFSEGGATQAEFQAPGAPTRYRLGNEAHTNMEFALDYRYDLHDTGAADDAYIQGYFMLDDFEPFGEGDELGLDHTAQAYVKFAGYLAPGVDLWMGRRYYDRQYISMNRHYWLNPGQNSEAGVGVEGWRVGPGELKAALFRNADANVTIGAATGTINSTVLDLRYAKPGGFGNGTTTVWGTLAQRAEQDELALPARNGFGIGLWHDVPDVLGGSNTTAFIYRTGAAIPQGPSNPNPVREDQGYDLGDATSWEINNNLVVEPGGDFALQWAAIVRVTDFGRRGIDGSMLRWYSTGIRPVYYLSQHASLAFEIGSDYVDDEVNDRAGRVDKYTVAWQLARERAYNSKPVLRLFATHAAWSNAFEGLVGNTPGDAPYGDGTSGWAIGTQFEASW